MIRRRFSEEGPTAFVWHVDAERKAASSWALVCVVWKRCRMERTVRARASVQTHALHTLVTTLGCAFEMGERKGDILKPTPSFHPAKGGGDAQRGRGPPAPAPTHGPWETAPGQNAARPSKFGSGSVSPQMTAGVKARARLRQQPQRLAKTAPVRGPLRVPAAPRSKAALSRTSRHAPIAMARTRRTHHAKIQAIESFCRFTQN